MAWFRRWFWQLTLVALAGAVILNPTAARGVGQLGQAAVRIIRGTVGLARG